MKLIYIVPILAILLLVKAAPTQDKTFIENLSEYASTKCPSVYSTTLLKQSESFIGRCNYSKKILEITKLDFENRGDVLCLLYLNNFLNLCSSTKNLNKPFFKLPPDIEKKLPSIVDQNSCSNIELNPTLSKTVLVELATNKKVCENICRNVYGNVENICGFAFYMSELENSIKRHVAEQNAQHLENVQSQSQIAQNGMPIPLQEDAGNLELPYPLKVQEQNKAIQEQTNDQVEESNIQKIPGKNEEEHDAPLANQVLLENHVDINSEKKTTIKNISPDLPQEIHSIKIAESRIKEPVQNTPVHNEPVHNIPVHDALEQNVAVPKAPVKNAPVQTAPAQNTPVENKSINQNKPPVNDDLSDSLLNTKTNVDTKTSPEVKQVDQTEAKTQTVVKEENKNDNDEVTSKAATSTKNAVSNKTPSNLSKIDDQQPPIEYEGDSDDEFEENNIMEEKNENEGKVIKPSKTEEDNSISSSYTMDMDGDSYFFSYFMMLCIVFVLGYVGYHNKQKILAIIVEGRRGRRPSRSRRPNSANYHKLDSNLEEAVTSACSKSPTQVIY